MRDTFDLLIIGGGVNGAGIARDAAGRGLSVLLCEQGDLASGTSSASSKLIHGGLRYLEQYRFAMVRKSLAEREVLLRTAPHLVRPLRFVLPHFRQQRPAWLVRLGLFLYDQLGGRTTLPRSGSVDLSTDPAGTPLIPSLRAGFQYTDCQVDDARLVVLTALDAAERGAVIHRRTRLVSAQRGSDTWTATLQANSAAPQTVCARAIINASGPWVPGVGDSLSGAQHPAPLRLVKGSHIVVPRLYDGAHAYILQNDDRRVVFVLPYGESHTLIGTTDVDYTGDPKDAVIEQDEIDYLCRAVGSYFNQVIGSGDIVWSFAGVRPLLDDATVSASRASRDYVLQVDTDNGAPLLTVYGGKLTTYRKLAEEALALLGTKGRAWTATAPLPGGNIIGGDFARFRATVAHRWPWLPEKLAARYARAYGTRVESFLADARGLDDLGENFGGGLYEAEVRYLVQFEWAQTADDILWRRTKLGLTASDKTVRRLSNWLDGGVARPGTAAAPIPAVSP